MFFGGTVCGKNDSMAYSTTDGHNSDIAAMSDFSDDEDGPQGELQPKMSRWNSIMRGRRLIIQMQNLRIACIGLSLITERRIIMIGTMIRRRLSQV